MLKPPGSLIIHLPNVWHLCSASPHHIAITITETEIETVIDTQYAINVYNKNEME